MIELVHTSVPHGLLSGDGGFCTVAATKDIPAALRQRLEQLSSYKHLVSAPGPQYVNGNPVAWSHLVLQTGEHLLSCVRACEFDYTNRTNRIARHWCFSPREVPSGTNFADVLLHGAAEELSTPWSGEPRWLSPRSGSPLASSTDRSDCRPVAWNALFGESRGPALAAGFAAALIHAVRDGGRGIVFRTSPAADADGVRALGLFADLLALVPADLRPRIVFSTYPATLPAWMPRHLVCLQSGDPALAACATFVDLEMGTVSGAERLPQDPDLLHLAQHGRKQAPPPSIRPFASSSAASAPAPSAPARGRTPAAPSGRLVRAPSGRLVSQSQVKKTKPEDILIYVLCGAIVLGAILCAWWLLAPSGQPTSKPPATPPPPTNAPAKPTPPPPEQPVLKPETPEPKNIPEKPSSPKKSEARIEKPSDTKTNNSKPEEDPLLSATTFVLGSPEQKKWKGTGRWYYYADNHWTNAEVKVVSGLGGRSNIKKPPKPVKLAFNDTEKKIYWCNPKQTEDGWFSDGKAVDVRLVVFGPDPRVFDLIKAVIEKQTGSEWKEAYRISFPRELGGDLIELPYSIDRHLEMSDVMRELERPTIQRFDDEINRIQSELTGAEHSCIADSNDWETAFAKLAPLESELAAVTNQIAVLNAKRKGKKGDDAKAINNQLNDLNQKRQNVEQSVAQPRREEKTAKRKLEETQKRVDAKKRELEMKRLERESFVASPERRNTLSRLLFRVEPLFPHFPKN